MCAFHNGADAVDFARDFYFNTGAPHILLRAGIHAGIVRVEENDIFGLEVNKAARIASFTDSGIRMSERPKASYLSRRGSGLTYQFSEAELTRLNDFGTQNLFRFLSDDITQVRTERLRAISEITGKPILYLSLRLRGVTR